MIFLLYSDFDNTVAAAAAVTREPEATTRLNPVMVTVHGSLRVSLPTLVTLRYSRPGVSAHMHCIRQALVIWQATDRTWRLSPSPAEAQPARVTVNWIEVLCNWFWFMQRSMYRLMLIATLDSSVN